MAGLLWDVFGEIQCKRGLRRLGLGGAGDRAGCPDGKPGNERSQETDPDLKFMRLARSRWTQTGVPIRSTAHEWERPWVRDADYSGTDDGAYRKRQEANPLKSRSQTLSLCIDVNLIADYPSK